MPDSASATLTELDVALIRIAAQCVCPACGAQECVPMATPEGFGAIVPTMQPGTHAARADLCARYATIACEHCGTVRFISLPWILKRLQS